MLGECKCVYKHCLPPLGDQLFSVVICRSSRPPQYSTSREEFSKRHLFLFSFGFSVISTVRFFQIAPTFCRWFPCYSIFPLEDWFSNKKKSCCLLYCNFVINNLGMSLGTLITRCISTFWKRLLN